mgnify:FL=1
MCGIEVYLYVSFLVLKIVMLVSKFSIEEMFRIQFQKKMELAIKKHFEMKKLIN